MKKSFTLNPILHTVWLGNSTLTLNNYTESRLFYFGENPVLSKQSYHFVQNPGCMKSSQIVKGKSYSMANLAAQFQTRFLELIPRPIAELKFSTQAT